MVLLSLLAGGAAIGDNKAIKVGKYMDAFSTRTYIVERVYTGKQHAKHVINAVQFNHSDLCYHNTTEGYWLFLPD